MSDEVSQFLEQVERLRGQQIEDDEARAREREEFLAAKRERQARREERARSISPQKSSPLNTPSPRSNRQSVQISNATRLGSPTRTSEDRERSASLSVDPDDSMSSPSLPMKEKEASVAAEAKQVEGSTPPARTPTLSWQRRPASRGGGVRPLSMVATQNATQRSLAEETQGPASATVESFSKDHIAKALGSKDPSWFRQTADRGKGSAAYRRNQVEDEDRLDMSSVQSQLPGMSVADSITKDNSRPKPGLEEPDHSRLASPITFSPPSFDGASDDKLRANEFSSLPGRTSPTRSPSPTKGLGGFVQSAMMKRSDSVKRWSVTSPPGLTRADSVAATRGAYDRSSVHMSSRQQGVTRGNSTTPTSSRPTSRHGDKQSDSGDVSKSSSQGSLESASREIQRDEDVARIPTSPSKTMDTRRWSPTKSSWLESALNRPESPKPSPSPSQPTWRDKAANESSRPTSVSHKHQVSIGGLMRQSALGNVAKSNRTGLGGIYSPPPNANGPVYGHGSKPSISQKQSDPELAKVDAESESDVIEEKSEEPTVEETTKRVVPVMMSPPPVKPKPQTPPTKDFRSTLRQRPAEKEPPKSNEPEFKNVFGNLRKTQTQNYVAPDELKTNILRGKAGLNVTDGPKKSERKDEFKDAILKKKADFKSAQAEGRSVTRTPSSSVEKPVPEGLAKRAELGKSAAAMVNKSRTSESTATIGSKKADSPKPIPGPKRVPSGSAFSPRSPNVTQSPAKSPSAEKLRHLSTEPQAVKTKVEPRAIPSLKKETSAPSKLADRFNPGLAGLLAKGPPAMSTNGGRSPGNSGKPLISKAGDTVEQSVPGPQLTHMTKNRARGPRRKAPTSAAAISSSGSGQDALQFAPASRAERSKETEQPERELPVKSLSIESHKVQPSTSQQKPAALSIQEQVAAKAATMPSKLLPTPGPKAIEPIKSPEPTTRPISRGRSQPLGSRETSSSPVKANPQRGDDASPASSPKKLDMKRVSRFFDEGSSHDVKQEPPKEPVRLSNQRTGSRSPTKLTEPPSPTKSDRDSLPSMRVASPRSGIRSPPISKPSFDERTTPAGLKRLSRPLSDFSAEGHKSPVALASPARSPTKQANEVSMILSDFFGPPQTRQTIKIDPEQILTSRPETSNKVTSLGLQMFQILGDGKKVPVSPQNERVLFDKEMYVCAHNFANQSGKKVYEIYFWVGDEVPESAAEDAQLFAQREARSLGGKLVKLSQGKETAEFIQALGGVVIVRRGSSIKYDSLAPNMLCGRRYLGQVAFDEVSYSTSSLCAGFTYLITKGGNCYMWNGKGSDVAEVSCARLVGMDLSLTGELVEYEDGREPDSFWELFDDKSPKPHSADHWRLKPSYAKYCSRLYCSNADSRQQIFEISPFNQADLSSASIYILDAFFEIYIIVGSRANSQYSSFRNALDFAQEYAILASSMEDRPFVPVATVVLEGIPRDLKRVFRKWDEGKSPTVTNASSAGQGLKRGKSLRVVTLTQALQALSD
ncbi:hypothetical protein QQS21_011653 [Conoideocrella luteorostrata]|uniref:DUF4045 domain-containing protein n=1 Tax=Conoideocrella luteorostrata TaxID=1105319 RepID=A0AAJ0FT54_9HYPO|nr:hypothetical protein QQS21_011653 [Conoideocrella luteorostrata]